ncbi:MAG: energy transducer TonB [Gemmatimonadales bacterium]
MGASSRLAGVLVLVLSSACAEEGEIEQPTPLYGQVPIDYPLHMWDQDKEGETILRVRVTDVGAVDSVEVLRTSGFGAFDSAAVVGARALRFTPARRDGERIAVWAEVPVYFSKRPRPDSLLIPTPSGGG